MSVGQIRAALGRFLVAKLKIEDEPSLTKNRNVKVVTLTGCSQMWTLVLYKHEARIDIIQADETGIWLG